MSDFQAKATVLHILSPMDMVAGKERWQWQPLPGFTRMTVQVTMHPPPSIFRRFWYWVSARLGRRRTYYLCPTTGMPIEIKSSLDMSDINEELER
jgi:hypothetical protein